MKELEEQQHLQQLRLEWHKHRKQQQEKKAAEEAAEVAAKEKEWIAQTLANIAQTKREERAARTIQWWWRRISADPANHVGFRRMLKLFEEL